MPLAHQFAEYAVKQLRNYGITVTSRTEASHSQVKRLLRSRNGDLRQLNGAVKEYHVRQKERYAELLHYNETKIPSFASGNALYQVIRGRVSHDALKEIRDQEKAARDAMAAGNAPNQCSNLWAQQMGLPCSHVLRQKIADGQMIEMRDIHRHWYLWRDNGNDLDADEDILRHTQDPRIRPSRRPNIRRHDAGTTRERSHDELRQRRRARPSAPAANPGQVPLPLPPPQPQPQLRAAPLAPAGGPALTPEVLQAAAQAAVSQQGDVQAIAQAIAQAMAEAVAAPAVAVHPGPRRQIHCSRCRRPGHRVTHCPQAPPSTE